MKNTDKSSAGRKTLSSLDVWAIAFGCMIGWGAFVMPGTTFLPIAGPAGTIISMCVGTLLMIVIGYNFSYLITHSSRTGGVYSYTKEAFGRDHAFLSSWFLCLSYLTIVFLNATAIFVVIRTVFGSSLQVGYYYTIADNRVYLAEVGVSALALGLVALLFIAAQSALKRLHTVLSIILFAGVAITAVICIPHADFSELSGSFGTMGISPAYACFSLIILAPWAFVGFDIISFETSSFAFPVKRSKWIIPVAIIAAGFAYIIMTVVSVSFVPDGYASWAEYITALPGLSGIASVPTFNSASAIMGTPGLVIMLITAVAAILTGLIGGYRAIIRVLSTMAEDRILSDKFSKNTYSILFITLISIVLAMLGRNTLNWFVDLTSFGAIVGFGYTSAAALKTARIENDRKAMITGIIGTAVSVLFAIVQIVPRLTAVEAMGGEAFLMLSLWCLLGFVFYWRTVTRSSLTEYSGISTSSVVLFALLVYSAIMWLAKLLYKADGNGDTHAYLMWGGTVLLAIIFIGLVVMLYVQNRVRIKHETIEREKIRAVESSLAKSRFLFNMSHDIRTPMNAIIGYTQLAGKEPSSDKVHDYLEKIEVSSGHLLALINDILEMSRIENGKIQLEYEPISLERLFGDIKNVFQEQMNEKNIDFKVYSSMVEHDYVWCDEKNLTRVLINLLGNALKFTPENGAVSLSLCEAGSSADGYASFEIRVQDNGIGMSSDFVSKMFNAFERERTSTDSGIQGTGLGLSITKSIIDLMGGSIDVLTSEGDGTEIIVSLKLKTALPEEVAANEESKAVKPHEDQESFAGKRLLLVEDNEINMEIAYTVLTQAGFEVEKAVNGREALDKVAASEPGYYDAVLMDIQMPVMDGYTATKAIRALDNKELARIPVLALTANAFKEDEEASKEAGMQAHIAKPIDINSMLDTIRDVLDRS